MSVRPWLAVAALAAAAMACARSDAGPSEWAPVIRLVPSSADGPARVEVAGLPASVLDDIDDEELADAEWSALLRVSVSDEAPAVLGSYEVRDGALRFTPAFPFDPGREYAVRFDPAVVAPTPIRPPLSARVALPARTKEPSTVVAQIYPSSEIVPENLLRFYIEFSAPMGRGSGLEYIELLDESGRPVEAPFLPLDYEFWSPDRRRFTVFFDPGRVKDGILPNKQLGRPLHAGRTYTLIVRREWHDGDGLPLKQEFRRLLRVGPAQTQPLDTAAWQITSPPAGGRAPLVVAFRDPLDHGLLMRALGVRMNGSPVAGDVRVEPGERRWLFTPETAWRAGVYEVLALSILEDVAGNQIGRAFEVDNFDTVDKSPDPKTVLLPFRIPPPTS